MRVLQMLARHGRLCLVAGLLAGLALPDLATALRPWVGALVALLLVLTATRIGARAALGSLSDMRTAGALFLTLQVALPLCALALFAVMGWLSAPFALAVALMLAAPSVTGAPNFAIMLGLDPAPSMRLLVLGTALFPLTALPVLMAVGGTDAMAQAVTLMAAILGAVSFGFLLRRLWPRPFTADHARALDGLSALTLGIVVIGLMSAIGPALRADPLNLMAWLVGVVGVNFTLQIAAALILRRLGYPAWTPISMIAGNRNIALFLLVLPPDIAAPLMIFIGCYQIPMYLTPILLAPLYRRI